MAVVRNVSRVHGQFLANGSTPTAPTTNNTLSAIGSGANHVSSLRLRTDIELYVLAKGTGTANIDLSFAYESIMVVGNVIYLAASTTNSEIPLTNENLPANVNRFGDWGQWDYLYPSIDFVNTVTPQLAVVTWRPKNGTIDTQFRRANSGTGGFDLFMPWEIQDGSGLINTSTGGVTYELGARFAQTWFWETKS